MDWLERMNKAMDYIETNLAEHIYGSRPPDMSRWRDLNSKCIMACRGIHREKSGYR